MARISRLGVALAWLLAPAAVATAAGAPVPASAGVSQQTVPRQGSIPLATASLEQCATAALGNDRSVTFVGEMSAIAETARMAIRIELQERLPEEATFHTVKAAGLGVWRESDPGVKAFKYLNKVTNLSAPASYRASIRFRWINAKGRPLKRLERHTASCAQPAEASAELAPLSVSLTGAAFPSWNVERLSGGRLSVSRAGVACPPGDGERLSWESAFLCQLPSAGR
jgi:hypothetical protein